MEQMNGVNEFSISAMTTLTLPHYRIPALPH